MKAQTQICFLVDDVHLDEDLYEEVNDEDEDNHSMIDYEDSFDESRRNEDMEYDDQAKASHVNSEEPMFNFHLAEAKRNPRDKVIGQIRPQILLELGSKNASPILVSTKE